MKFQMEKKDKVAAWVLLGTCLFVNPVVLLWGWALAYVFRNEIKEGVKKAQIESWKDRFYSLIGR